MRSKKIDCTRTGRGGLFCLFDGFFQVFVILSVDLNGFAVGVWSVLRRFRCVFSEVCVVFACFGGSF